MKTLTGFGVLISIASALFAAQPAVTNTPADFMIQNFLKAEAARLDTFWGAHAPRVPFFRALAENSGRTELTRAFQKMPRAMMLDARARPATPEGGCAPQRG